jgi:uncharacterized protein YdbL (DUF1318 family)
MKSLFVFRLLFLLAVAMFGAAGVQAQDLGAVKARMDARFQAIMAMKDRGVVGENNRGFLEVRGGASGPEQQTISEENSDRRTVYAALAAQTGARPEDVGRTRAQQIATSVARRGHWIQDQNDQWRQKS